MAFWAYFCCSYLTVGIDVSIAFLGQTIPILREGRKEGNKKRVRKISATRLLSCFNVKKNK
ncbi:hypothetical protein ASPFODRAFT_39166 [Aspergillus luchuensis CBS 106.47]|uniref:Uncharacterized protein n=1 Tax=Aspergillus luchuensis (strain CBS 106.47) TaxID=1137211 RepID=A0A1M3TYU5_ASPLC|nr:hypothetical protein ASPFODRAFT_39166 [Aspergillus luchuensis CBS 106.47]